VRKALICLFGTALLAPFSISAQAAPKMVLKAASAKLEEEFTLIGSVRELRDGRVLISDARENRVVVADFKSGAVTQVGRSGKGPNEYAMAAPVRPIAGDSSLLFDVSTRRWLLLDGPVIVSTIPADAPIVVAMKGVGLGADARGNVWKTEGKMNFGPDGNTAKPGTTDFGPTDSSYLIRMNRATIKADTLAQLRVAPSRMSVVNDAKGKIQSVGIVRPPYSVGEEAALFLDGSFAIARLEPYRVDWISPDGKVAKGAPIASPLIKVTAAEKEAFLSRQQAARGATRGSGPPNSAASEAIQRDLAALREQFPDFIPPFQTGSLIAAGDGSLWIRKPPSMEFVDARYDVVDRRSRLVGTLSLAAGERIVTVTRTAVYIAWKDADEIERLRRHPWP
jgi:hypothetical protein